MVGCMDVMASSLIHAWANRTLLTKIVLLSTRASGDITQLAIRLKCLHREQATPGGVDFNDQGQCFLTCCVIPHLFHIIQGANYRRQAGRHFNPYLYDDIKTIAVHRHWGGNHHRMIKNADKQGGGHAHSGAMIYLADSWPKKYRNQLFMNNIHGARLNQDQLTKKVRDTSETMHQTF